MLEIDTTHQVIRFVVYDEPIWRFDQRIEAVDPGDHPDLVFSGDTSVVPINDGLAINVAVEDFDDCSIASQICGEEWFERAVKALNGYLQRHSPTGILRLYRDPADGSLRKIKEDAKIDVNATM